MANNFLQAALGVLAAVCLFGVACVVAIECVGCMDAQEHGVMDGDQ